MPKKINIRPTTSVYATYKNIKYDPWTAIAEYVDNSVQSYYDNKRVLTEIPKWEALFIEIKPDKDDNGKDRLIIKDNAYGMNFKDFQRAIILDSKPQIATRSEFGMGLKTASCWFGTKWSVESVEYGSGIKYKAIVDVDALSQYKNEEIEVEEIECDPEEHGTIITIWDMNRKIVGRQIKKTKDKLSGMYRVDIRSGEINIYYNDEELSFQSPEVLIEQLPNKKTKEWKEKVDFKVEYDGKEYRVFGFMALLDTASTSGAGFTLIRRGRVIIGGYEDNYRPEEIFAKSTTFVYQRLFGELHMNFWPVTQAKDDFDWHGGLEDAFIDKLNEVVSGYKKKAKEYRKGKEVSSEEQIMKAVASFKDAGIIKNVEFNPLPKGIKETPISQGNKGSLIDNSFPAPIQLHDTDGEPVELTVTGNDGNKVTFECNGTKYTLNLIIAKNDPYRQWLYVTRQGNAHTYKVEWNIHHPFFKNCLGDPKLQVLMIKFIFTLVLSEIEAMRTGTKIDGNLMIDPSAIRMQMNEILKIDMSGVEKFA